MEGLFSFAGLIMIVFGILQIILFFKLWGMTNDIKAIKNKYFESSTNNSISSEATPKNGESKFEAGALVVNINSGKQMRIKEFNSATGKYSCYTNGGLVFEGDFDESEIKLF